MLIFDADLDPPFDFDADPDLHSDADPDPASGSTTKSRINNTAEDLPYPNFKLSADL
jgi:hypothetical protein